MILPTSILNERFYEGYMGSPFGLCAVTYRPVNVRCVISCIRRRESLYAVRHRDPRFLEGVF
jgi:hypothetical protein